MRISAKQRIQEETIKNLLSAQKRIADHGSGKEVVLLVRFSLHLAEKFRDVFVDARTKSDEEWDGEPVDDLKKP